MKTNRHSSSFTRGVLPVFLALLSMVGCQQGSATESVSDGSWNAAFRVSAGNLTTTQMASATWVRVEASRSGGVVAFAEAAYDLGRVTLTIPNAGAVDITLTGYDNSTTRTVMWVGTAWIDNGGTNPVVALAAGPGLTPVSAPTFSPDSGSYTTAQTVTISSSTTGAEIYYTTDGSTPTSSSTKYTTSVSVGSTQTLKAIALKSGMTTSSVETRTYTIQPLATVSVTDPAGQTYKTVTIGSQTWMAENLNYAGANGTTGVCYGNSTDSCKKYGRLYTWSEVMQGSTSSRTSPSNVKGICPTGWHVPSDAEWTTLENYVDASGSTEGTKLKSTSGWSDTGNGTDAYGFRALPGGQVFIGTSDYAGYLGYWWTATENDAANAWRRGMNYTRTTVDRNYQNNAFGHALRCLED